MLCGESTLGVPRLDPRVRARAAWQLTPLLSFWMHTIMLISAQSCWLVVPGMQAKALGPRGSPHSASRALEHRVTGRSKADPHMAIQVHQEVKAQICA